MAPAGSAISIGPDAEPMMPVPPYVGFGSRNCVTCPFGLTRPTFVVLYSVNHIEPCGPAAI